MSASSLKACFFPTTATLTPSCIFITSGFIPNTVYAWWNVFSEAIESNFQHLSASVRNIALSSRLAILSCSYANRLIFLLTADSKSDTVYLQNTISNNFEYIQALHASRGGFMKMAFSRTFTKLNQIKQCYHEITVALSTKNLHALFPNHIIHYENLGIYRILFELDKNESIRDYCMKNIDPLISYDAQHSSSLLETLRLYFINNCHSSQTAQALFIHKNTTHEVVDSWQNRHRFLPDILMQICHAVIC